MWMGWMTDDSSNRGYWGYLIWRIEVFFIVDEINKCPDQLHDDLFKLYIYTKHCNSKTQNPNIGHG